LKLSILILFSTLALRAADYSTYIGDDLASRPKGIATDASGSTYVLADRRNVAGYFVGTVLVKLNPSGAIVSNLDLTDLAPGTNAIAVDSPGNVYLVTSGGSLMELDGHGNVLFSMQLGGTQGTASLNAVAIDAAGSIYVGGETDASDYPHAGGSPQGSVQAGIEPTYGAFFAKLSPTGKIIYAGAIAATKSCLLCRPTTRTSATAIALDSAGNAYIAGNTTGSALTGTEGTPNAAGTGDFLLKLDPSGALAYIQLGFGGVVAVDSVGNVYTGNAGGVAKLNPAGGTIWVGPLSNNIGLVSLAVDSAGNVWFAGFPNGPEYLEEIGASGTGVFIEHRPPNTTDAGLAVDSNGIVHLAGSTGLISTFTPSQSQAPRIFGIGNAAGGVLSGRVAPGEIISIYGENFGSAANVGNTSLSFLNGCGGRLQAPAILYVSDTQINAIVPPLAQTDATSDLELTINGVALPPMRVVIDPAEPEIFQTLFGAAINQDGSLNSSMNPAKPGSFVSLWASGAGGSGPQIASGAYEYPSCPCAVIGGSYNNAFNGSLYTPYFGAAPGMMASITQVNIQIPQAVQSTISVRLNVYGIYSDPVAIWIAP
jgi:uncharacterized protein (TIGR03437 family)